MKRQFKALTGILCASAMALTGLAAATSASAADPTCDIVIENTSESDEFEAFRLFNATWENGEYTYTVSNPAYLTAMLEAAGLNAADYEETSTDPGDATADAEAAEKTTQNQIDAIKAYLKAKDTNGDNVIDPSTKVDDFFTTLYNDSIADKIAAELPASAGHVVSDNEDSTTGFAWKFSNAPYGYYLIHQVAGSGTTQYELIGADTTTVDGSELRIEPKHSTVIFTKKVKDYNTSTGERSDWQDSADLSANNFSVGWGNTRSSFASLFPFRLQATLPTDIAEYTDGFQLVFHDEMSDLFDRNGYFNVHNLRVYVGDIADENLVEGWNLACKYRCAVNNVAYSDGAWHYTEELKDSYRTATSANDTDNLLKDDDSMVLSFSNLFDAYYVNRASTEVSVAEKSDELHADDAEENTIVSYMPVNLQPGTIVTVIYESMLSSANGTFSSGSYEGISFGGQAGEDGNENTAYVEYTNSSANSVTALTSSIRDTVKIFYYGLNVEKVDKDGVTPLSKVAGTASSNAQFALYQFVSNDESRTGTRVESTMPMSGMILQGESLDGTTHGYKAPADGWWVKVATNEANGFNGVAAYGDSNAMAQFTGLGDGLYKLVEVETPQPLNAEDTPYAAADDVIFEISADHQILADDPQLTTVVVDNELIDDTNGVTTGILTTTIANYPDTKLPSTGGMGTVLFYTIGGLVILVAVAGLAYSMKKHQEA